MKRTLPVLLLLLTFVLSATIEAQVRFNTVFDQLIYVNQEWENQPDADPSLKTRKAAPLNEQQLIQQHLTEVEKLLRTRKLGAMSAALIERRNHHLDVLHQYLTIGIFPVNAYHQQRQPYFIDEYNTFCAVGYLIKESGAETVAREIQRTQNYSYLADIHHEKLMGWVQASGLRFDELALIQPSYDTDWPPAIVEFHYNNTGADVNEYIEVHRGSGINNGFGTLTEVRLYDAGGTLYKSLTPATMQSFFTTTSIMYWYLFPSGESFADEGRIEVWARNLFLNVNQLLSSAAYNSTSVSVTNYISGSPVTTNYPIAESESTSPTSSLNFCGKYGAPGYTLTSMVATRGTLNPCVVLPLSLTSFTSTTNDKQVVLSWQTATEAGTKEFVIERSSNGVDFIPVGTIPAAGNSSSARNYSFTDRLPGYINHYRLKLSDIDGKFTYSKILYVKVSGASALQLERTMVKNTLRYQVAPGMENARLEIYDMSGRSLYSSVVAPGARQLDITDWPAGKYIIRLLANDGQLFHQQFIKQ